MTGGPIKTHDAIPGLLDRWGIPLEGVISVCRTKIRQYEPGVGSAEVAAGFQWIHLESTTKVSMQKGFGTRHEGEKVTQDRAKLCGAIYTTRPRSAANGGLSS